MTLTSILYSLASVPMFASRPFLAAFVTCALARHGADIPWFRDHEVVRALAGAPAWFQSGWMMAALAILAALEVLAVKHAEVREFLADFDGFVKSAVATLVALAVMDSETAQTIQGIQRGGFGVEGLGAVLVGGLTWSMAALRRGVMHFVSEIDDHDDLGLQSVLSWAENSWTVLGILFLVILPIVAVVLSALTVVGLWLVRRAAEKRELASKVPCAACGAPTFPHASACPRCRAALAAPRAVGVFGQPKSHADADPANHRFALVARKRCPVCATRLVKRAVQQPCPECATLTFASLAEFERYGEALRARLPRTLLVCAAFSAVPVLGIIPGVVYYRLALVSGLRGYIPPLRGCLARVLVRFVRWGLIAFQPIPLAGALVVPAMAWLTFLIYRRALTGRARLDLAATGADPGAVSVT